MAEDFSQFEKGLYSYLELEVVASVIRQIGKELLEQRKDSIGPFHYSSERAVQDEIYHRLRKCIHNSFLPVKCESKTSDMANFREEYLENLETFGKGCRVRQEVSLVTPDGCVLPKDGGRNDYDLVVFCDDQNLKNYRKEEGIGDHWLTSTDVDLLCEIKHSKNESSKFQTESVKEDIERLSQFPGDVSDRVFVFMEWWPFNGSSEELKFEEHFSELKNDVEVNQDVIVIYLVRSGTKENHKAMHRVERIEGQ